MTATEKTYRELIDLPDVVLVMEKVQQQIEQENQKRADFHDLVHENMKAEFINGEIIMHSPVKSRHWIAVTNLTTFLNYHVLKNNLGLVGSEKVMIHLTRNDYEPDVVFFGMEKATNFTPTQMLFPAPDFVAEVLSDSTEKKDRGIKFRDFEAHGVQEYWIIDPEAESVEQYLLSDKKEYILQQKLVQKGVLKSSAVEDFDIEISILFNLKKLSK